MKRNVVLMTAIACLLLSAVATFAQTKTDFSGEWTLDVSKSKLSEMNRIESGTVKVTQTDKDFSFTTDFKRPPRPEGAPAGGGGMGRGGTMGGGGSMQPLTYTLDGKEATVNVAGPQGSTVPMKFKAEWDGAKLKLTTVRSFNTPNGEITATTTEIRESLEGGKALKRTVESQSPRGTQTNEYYFTKK